MEDLKLKSLSDKKFTASFWDNAVKMVEFFLSRERFMHSLGCNHQMMILAEAQGIDKAACGALGLLHDCARGFSQLEIRNRLENCGNDLPDVDSGYPGIWHARLGAIMMKQQFGVDDSVLVESVRIHPTGGPDMSLPARMLFVADFTEPARDFEGVEDLRHLAARNFEAAFRAVLKNKTRHVLEMGGPLHPDSLAALKFYNLEVG